MCSSWKGPYFFSMFETESYYLEKPTIHVFHADMEPFVADEAPLVLHYVLVL